MVFDSDTQCKWVVVHMYNMSMHMFVINICYDILTYVTIYFLFGRVFLKIMELLELLVLYG